MEGYIPDELKTDLSIKQLVWCGHEIKNEAAKLKRIGDEHNVSFKF